MVIFFHSGFYISSLTDIETTTRTVKTIDNITTQQQQLLFRMIKKLSKLVCNMYYGKLGFVS